MAFYKKGGLPGYLTTLRHTWGMMDPKLQRLGNLRFVTLDSTAAIYIPLINAKPELGVYFLVLLLAVGRFRPGFECRKGLFMAGV